MGSELLGLGPRNVAVKDTLTWRGMTTAEKFEFWRERMERVAPDRDAMEMAARFARVIKHGTMMPRQEDDEVQKPMSFTGGLGVEHHATFFRSSPTSEFCL